MDYLLSLYGLGPVKAAEVLKRITGPKTRENMRRQLLKMTDLPEFTMLDLEHDVMKQVPRGAIRAFEETLANVKTDDIAHIEVLGSYARGRETSGDIDVLVCQRREPFTKISLRQENLVVASGDKKDTVLLRIPLNEHGEEATHKSTHEPAYVWAKSDIYYCTPDEYVAFKMYLIGDRRFNIIMRGTAKRKGYMLSQYGLFDAKTGDRIPIKNEEDVFRLLGLEYKTPSERSI